MSATAQNDMVGKTRAMRVMTLRAKEAKARGETLDPTAELEEFKRLISYYTADQTASRGAAAGLRGGYHSRRRMRNRSRRVNKKKRKSRRVAK